MRRITLAQVPVVKAAILNKRQNNKCAVCSHPLTIQTGCLDHNHTSGRIRGVLCRNCNGIEGKMRNLATRGRRGMSHEDYLGQMLKYWLFHLEDRTGLYHHTHLNEEEKRVKRNAKARKKRAATKKVK